MSSQARHLYLAAITVSLVTSTCAMAMATVIALSVRRHQSEQVVRAGRFEVRDAHGHLGAILCCDDDGTRLSLFDAEGRLRTEVAPDRRMPAELDTSDSRRFAAVRAFDDKGRAIAVLHTSFGGGGGVGVTDGTVTSGLVAEKDGQQQLSIGHKAGTKGSPVALWTSREGGRLVGRVSADYLEQKSRGAVR